MKPYAELKPEETQINNLLERLKRFKKNKQLVAPLAPMTNSEDSHLLGKAFRLCFAPSTVDAKPLGLRNAHNLLVFLFKSALVSEKEEALVLYLNDVFSQEKPGTYHEHMNTFFSLLVDSSAIIGREITALLGETELGRHAQAYYEKELKKHTVYNNEYAPDDYDDYKVPNILYCASFSNMTPILTNALETYIAISNNIKNRDHIDEARDVLLAVIQHMISTDNQATLIAVFNDFAPRHPVLIATFLKKNHAELEKCADGNNKHFKFTFNSVKGAQNPLTITEIVKQPAHYLTLPTTEAEALIKTYQSHSFRRFFGNAIRNTLITDLQKEINNRRSEADPEKKCITLNRLLEILINYDKTNHKNEKNPYPTYQLFTHFFLDAYRGKTTDLPPTLINIVGSGTESILKKFAASFAEQAKRINPIHYEAFTTAVLGNVLKNSLPIQPASSEQRKHMDKQHNRTFDL